MPDPSSDPALPEPTPPSQGEPDEPGESADPLTAPTSVVGDEVHDAMVDDADGTGP